MVKLRINNFYSENSFRNKTIMIAKSSLLLLNEQSNLENRMESNEKNKVVKSFPCRTNENSTCFLIITYITSVIKQHNRTLNVWHKVFNGGNSRLTHSLTHLFPAHGYYNGSVCVCKDGWRGESCEIPICEHGEPMIDECDCQVGLTD